MTISSAGAALFEDAPTTERFEVTEVLEEAPARGLAGLLDSIPPCSPTVYCRPCGTGSTCSGGPRRRSSAQTVIR